VPDHRGRATFIGRYEADFAYVDRQGVTHVEDVKGIKTAVYALKKRLVEALWGIAVEEVR
jgi:hypothetical protein